MYLFFGQSLVEAAIKSVYDIYKSNSSGTDVTSEEKAVTVDAANSVVEIQAKAQQELSIAKRIMIAETVEITEEYEASGAGSLGVKNDPSSLKIGAHGEGRKMTKRTIKFTGFNSKIEDVISHLEEAYKTTHPSEGASSIESDQVQARTPS